MRLEEANNRVAQTKQRIDALSAEIGRLRQTVSEKETRLNEERKYLQYLERDVVPAAKAEEASRESRQVEYSLMEKGVKSLKYSLNTLVVEFGDGTRLKYTDIPDSVFVEMERGVRSTTAAYDELIRARYPYEETEAT